MKNIEKFITEWEKTREKGKKKYVLTSGVWMGMTTLITSIIARTIKGDVVYSYFNIYLHIASFSVSFIVTTLFSINTWNSNKKKYKELTGHRKE